MEDEVVRHDDVLNSFSPDVREALVMALPPAVRGWWTEEEIQAFPDYDWVEMTEMGSRHLRFIPGRRNPLR